MKIAARGRGGTTMSSEFPMSFAQVSEVKAKKKRDTHLSVLPDYPMSQFDDGTTVHQSTQKRGRGLLRGTLLLTFLGLWGAIATGHLHSDLPLVESLRSNLFLGSDSTAELSNMPEQDPTLTSEPMQNTGAVGDAVPAAGAAQLPTALETPVGTGLPAAPQQTQIGQDTLSGSDAGKSKSSPVEGSTAVESKVPPLPNSISAADVERMAKLFVEQGTQNQALEEHLLALMIEHSSAENLRNFIDAMERRHQSALKLLKQQKVKSKSDSL